MTGHSGDSINNINRGGTETPTPDKGNKKPWWTQIIEKFVCMYKSFIVWYLPNLNDWISVVMLIKAGHAFVLTLLISIFNYLLPFSYLFCTLIAIISILFLLLYIKT